MHVTATLQITEYYLINNSCMSIQTETELRTDGGAVYYQLLEYSILNISCMQKEFFPWGLRSYFFRFFECDEANSHMWHHWTPRKTVQGNRRLGGLEEDIYSVYWVCKLYSLIAERADSFYNLNKISTCMIIQSWYFRLMLSSGYFFCVMCDWFLLISYLCSIDLAHIQSSFRIIVCRSRSSILL